MEIGNWFEYKGNIINLDKTEVFRVQRARKSEIEYTDIVCKGDKKWILYAGYTPLDAFSKKDEALRVARDILAGKHKVKMPR
jgi:hypothetical protein